MMADSEYPDDIQFAGLVQAATAAADEQTRNYRSLGKRKRDSNDVDQDDFIPIDHNLTNSLIDESGPDDSIQLQNSASVLFREPSVKSKKYSRPPLGKVYASLELAAETFLKLQSECKRYMLDPDHPERRDVVGHRKNNEGNDIAKLKLWHCVEDFLHNEGHGERFFGHGAGEGIPGAPMRTIFWPHDAQKIIKLCMPLMRKMVTNERQRVYAAETRKTPNQSEEQPNEEDKHSIAASVPTSTAVMPSVSDPHENGEGPEPSSSASAIEVPEALPAAPAVTTEQAIEESSSVAAGSAAKLHINLVHPEGDTTRRIIPRFTLPPENATSIVSLMTEVQKRFRASPRSLPGGGKIKFGTAKISVWMPDGLVSVRNDGEWMVTLLSASSVEWMDKEIRVLVEV